MAINLGDVEKNNNYNNGIIKYDGLNINTTVKATLPTGEQTSKSKKSHYNLLKDGYQFGDLSKMFIGEAKQGVNNLKDTIFNTPKNTINAAKGMLNQSEALKDGYQFGDITKTVGSTLLSGAQNFGEGVIRGGEQLIDFGADITGGASDFINTKLEKAVGLHKGKSESEINKEKAQSRKEMIKKNYTDELMKAVGKDEFYKDLVESDSLIKTDNMSGAIAQELGRQSLNLLINNKIGSNNKITQSLPMLMGSYGSGLEEAYQNGATTEEARKYGILNAATETATEWVTGGIPGLKGTAGKGLDGFASKLIGENIDEASKKLSKALLKSGYKLIGEGTEEALSEFINPYLKQFTYEYNNNKDIFGNISEATSKISPQNMITSFIMGAITAGIIDAPNNLSDIKVGYQNTKINSLNKNIKNNSINTPQINELQISNIDNQKRLNSVQNSLKQNDINNLNKTIEYLPTGNSKINSLNNNIKNNNINTPKLNELQTSNINNQQNINSSENALNTAIISDKNKTIEYLPTGNDKIDNLYQSAIQNNVNNTQESKNLLNTFSKIIKDKNYNVLFDSNIINDNGNSVNAQIKTLENGEVEIRINPNSDRAGEFLIMHEVTHSIETNSIKELVLDYASKNSEFNESLESLKQTYGTNDVSSEVLADISGQLFGNQEFINNLSLEKPNLFKRIYNSIISLANKITGNSKESLFIKDLKNKWENAYRTQNNNLNNTAYSIQTDNFGKKYVNVDTDQDIFVGKTLSEQTKIAKKYILDTFRENGINVNNENINITSRTANEYTHPKNKNSKDITSSKMKASTELDNLLNIAEYSHSNDDDGRHMIAKDGWDYYKVNFNVGNQSFEGLINIAKNGDIKTLYDITKIKKTSRVGSDNKSTTTNVKSFSKDNISQNDISVKSNTLPDKYSMQESKNNTDKWQEHLDKNYKSTGTRTNIKDITTLPIPENYQKKSIKEVKPTIKEINQKKMENNTNAINRLNQEKDAMIKRLQDKINYKQELLKSKSNKDTKIAAQLNMQISMLNNQIQNRTLEFNKKIELLESRNSKINSEEFKTQEQRMTKKQEYIDQAYELTEDMLDWKDKDKGIKYQINTMKRNLYDIMPKSQADKMYNTYFQPISENNAKSENFINSYNERISKLNLNNKESIAVQMLGEYKYNKETLITGPEVDRYISDNKLNYDKLSNAVEEFRTIYDELITETNTVLKEQGYKEIEYRKGYFPHFQEETSQSKFSKLAEKIGFKTNKNDSLPTDIAGMTEIFKPGKTYFKNAQQRKGKITDYNALKGYDNYIRGAADIIFHTEDIQKLRALEHVIRTQYTDSEVQKRLEDIYNNNDLDQEQKQQLVDLEYLKINNPLPNLVTEIRNYTDTLANKKDIGDRGMEHMLGRETYTIMKNVQSRVSANMVGFNISSALTNFIPITQAWGEVSTKNMAKAIKQSIANQFHSDGFADCSTYLINRTKQADRLYKTPLDNINSKAGIIFESVDSITSNVIVRGKYYDNIDKGMTQEQAIKNANEFAKDIMAGRSKGDMPTIFNRKSPLVKLFTAFQLEVNNQYGYMLKDLPRNLSDEAKKKLIGAFAKMFIGAWLYNKFSESITGRKSAFSPIDIATESIQTINNDNLSDSKKLSTIFNNISKEIPFIGGIAGGGRLSIQAAIPYSNPISAVTSTLSDTKNAIFSEKEKNKAIKNLLKEWSKPVFYVAMPFGGGQLKKTIEGASMYSHSTPGSYTTTGKLRFTAKKDPLSIGQNLLFGQYSSKEARDYFDNGYAPLSENQIKELRLLNIDMNTYREYRNEYTKLNKIKGDKNSKGTIINGSASGKKAYEIMNNSNYSLKEKNYLLSTLSTNKEKTTVDELNKIANDENIYKYYFSLNNDSRKEFINAINKYNFDSYQLYDYHKTKKIYEEQYVSYRKKDMLINYLLSSNLTNDQKKYLYSMDYLDENKINILNTFNINFDNYLNTTNYINELKRNYSGTKYSNYRKKQTFSYIQNLKAPVIEKIILFNQAGYSITSYKNIIYQYINNLNINEEQKQNLWNQIY